jgi:ATP-dependent protease ClpP protease subunit
MLQFLQEEQEPFIRYVHYFDDEFTPESVQELIGILSAVPSVDLFLTTPGGYETASKVLLHFINNHPDIKIYLTGYIASAGTFFLTDCDKEVYITDELDWILFHHGDRDFGGKFRKQTLNTDILYDQLKESNKVYLDKYKRLGLSSKELKLIDKGEDVILYKKDFHRLKINRK